MSQEKPGIIHLPKTTSAPSLTDLRLLVKTSLDNIGCKVELTWSVPGAASAYRLIARMESGSNTPSWTLKQIDGVETREIWASQTGELERVLDTCRKLSGAPQATALEKPEEENHRAARS